MNKLVKRIGASIRKERIKRGWTLQQLARKSGQTGTHVWQIENAHSANPGITKLAELLAALDIPLEQALGLKPTNDLRERLLGFADDLERLAKELRLVALLEPDE